MTLAVDWAVKPQHKQTKYKYGQQEQVAVRNHNRSTALERSVLKYWRA